MKGNLAGNDQCAMLNWVGREEYKRKFKYGENF